MKQLPDNTAVETGRETSLCCPTFLKDIHKHQQQKAISWALVSLAPIQLRPLPLPSAVVCADQGDAGKCCMLMPPHAAHPQHDRAVVGTVFYLQAYKHMYHGEWLQ